MGGLSHTVSGNIASFRTPSRVPIESLKFHFLPKQAAGTPSPENPIPIEGWTGLNGKRCHKNIIKPYYSVVTVRNGLTITPTANGIRISGTAESRTPCFICTTDNIKLGAGDKVAFSLYVNGDISECENPFLGYYKSIGVWGSVIYSFSSSSNWNHTIWTVPDTYTDISYIDSYIYIPQGVTVNFEIGLQGIISSYYSDDYEPYSGEQIPITFPDGETIYGGYIDPVVGEIVAEYKTHVWTGTETNFGMNFRTSDRFYALVTDQECQYGNNGSVKSNMLKTQYNHGADTCYQRPSDAGYLMDFARTTICDLSLEDYDALTNAQQSQLARTYLAGLYANGTPLVICFKLMNPVHIPVAPQNLKAFLDYNNFWSDANDITEVTYTVTESKDILATRKKAQSFNDYFQGELVFELNGDDAPIDGKWIERVNGWEFTLLGDALYDTTNKVYDFSGRSLAFTGTENTNKLSMGHHFRIEWDLYYKRKLCNSSIFFDICSLTSADKAIGIGLLTKSDTSTISFNWKLNGNNSNPWTGGSEQRISPITIPMDDNFTHFTGFHEIIPGNDNYDRARVKINDHIIKYTTPIPKANYSGPWQSQIKAISVGAGVYNIAALQRNSTGDSSYYCECKIKNIKIYKYD